MYPFKCPFCHRRAHLDLESSDPGVFHTTPVCKKFRILEVDEYMHEVMAHERHAAAPSRGDA